MEKISIKQRDIILIKFPYSDFSDFKVRPALVISNNLLNQGDDVIILGITTNIKEDKFSHRIELNNLEQKSIKEECCIKIENIQRLDKRLIIKKIDSLNIKDFNKVLEKIPLLF